uniref:Uncharacterized protein n=1 Tax=Alexandrium monilatum TaxID=311494 RepID=A0A7S4SJG6_9DINO
MGCSHAGGEGAPAQPDGVAPRPSPASPPSKGAERTAKSQQERQLAAFLEAHKRDRPDLEPCFEDGPSTLQAGKNTDAAVGANESYGRCGTTDSSTLSVGRMPSSLCGARRTSLNSQVNFAESDQTIIIFDWDDTLCPTTCLRRVAATNDRGRLSVKLTAETQSDLNMLADQVHLLLSRAKMMGKVVIVTNAARPWVDISCSCCLPALKVALQDVPVLYATEHLKEAHGSDNLPTWLLTQRKARAMKAAVSDFYSRYPEQSWKNVVSIGDAFFERDAIEEVVQSRPMRERCRTKTVKLLEAPTIAGMVVQISLIENWLAKIVQMDGDIAIDLDADEETMNSWVSLFSQPGEE